MDLNIAKLVSSLEAVSFERDIFKHEATLLQETLINQNKRQKKGKPLGLVDSDRKFGQFFSPERIKVAQEASEQKEQAIQQEIKTKATAKAIQTEQRIQKQLAKEEKSRQFRERVANNKIKREVLRLARLQAKQQRQITQSSPIKQPKQPKHQKTTQISVLHKISKLQDIPIEKEMPTKANETIQPATRLGRQIKLPTRFDI